MASVKADKIWTDAIRKAVKEWTDDPDDPKGEKVRKINQLAKTLVTQGLQGNTAALKEIGDRLDGRAPGESNVNVRNSGTVTHVHETIQQTAEWLRGTQEPDSPDPQPLPH